MTHSVAPVPDDTQVLAPLLEAAEALSLDDEVVLRLTTPLREIALPMPIRRDDGQVAVVSAYRVHHSDAAGPTFGGVRFHPDTTLPLIRGLAIWQMIQCALFALPFGSAMGGVAIDPTVRSSSELQRISRLYAARLARLFGDHADLIAPDLGTDGQIMAWMADELAQRQGPMPAAVTGKPIALGGSLGRRTATGRALVLVLEEVLQAAGETLSGQRLAIQGFGNVGRAVADAAVGRGALIVAASDVHAAMYDPDGLDLAALADHHDTHGTLAGFRAKQTVEPPHVPFLDADIFVPAAVAGVLDADGGAALKCHTVIEAAPLALSHQADRVLAERGRRVIPAALAAAGGAIVSYAEWVQNLHRFYWDADKVDAELERVLLTGIERVLTKASAEGLTLRAACYRLALARLEEAERLRGRL